MIAVIELIHLYLIRDMVLMLFFFLRNYIEK